MKNNELTVKIKFNGPVSQENMDTFTRLLDEEMAHELVGANPRRWVAKTQHRGWGMGSSLVTEVERVR